MPVRTKRLHAFTLVELLAVTVMIVLLAALSIRVVGYVKGTIAISNTKAQIATMCAALEMYKADVGHYPATSPARISHNGDKESTNNWYLYRALSGTCTNCGKVYMHFSAPLVQINMQTTLTNIFDPWGTPYNYYCSPSTTYAVSNAIPAGYTGYWYSGYAVGGQANGSTYDLWSYGPDKVTYVPGAVAYTWPSNYAWYFGGMVPWTNQTSALDDITNWKR